MLLFGNRTTLQANWTYMPQKPAAKPLCFDQITKTLSGRVGTFRRAVLEDTVATREVCAPERRHGHTWWPDRPGQHPVSPAPAAGQTFMTCRVSKGWPKKPLNFHIGTAWHFSNFLRNSYKFPRIWNPYQNFPVFHYSTEGLIKIFIGERVYLASSPLYDKSTWKRLFWH